MTEQRVIIEMGMGTDLHGRDYAKAACRAVETALRGVSLPILRQVDAAGLRVQITIGVADPDAVDKSALAAMIPHGAVSVSCVQGGLDVDVNGDVAAVAQASIEVFLPPQTGWRLRSH